MVLSISLAWDQAWFCQPQIECAAVDEGNSPLVMPEGSALTLQISTLVSASWLRLGLSLVPELWVRWGVLHMEPETLMPDCLHPSRHAFKSFAYLQRIWVFCGAGLLPVTLHWMAWYLLWRFQRIGLGFKSLFVCSC